MPDRLVDKASPPTPEQVEQLLGAEGYRRLQMLEAWLRAHYDLSAELRFPFGASYGWGYKYSHKSTHLCYAFFEAGAFIVTIQIGDKQVAALTAVIDGLTAKAQDLWTRRYPCGNQGGWVHYEITSDDQLGDIYDMVIARKRPPSR